MEGCCVWNAFISLSHFLFFLFLLPFRRTYFFSSPRLASGGSGARVCMRTSAMWGSTWRCWRCFLWCSGYYPACPSFHLRCVCRASSKSPTITRAFTEMENVRISDFHGFSLSHLLPLFDFLRGSRHFSFDFSPVFVFAWIIQLLVFSFFLSRLSILFFFSMSLSRQRIVSHCCWLSHVNFLFLVMIDDSFHITNVIHLSILTCAMPLLQLFLTLLFP